MNDDALSDAWRALEPTNEGRRRIDARVSAWLEARDTSLVEEWFGLLRREPIVAPGLATVSAIWIVATPLLAWLARALI